MHTAPFLLRPAATTDADAIVHVWFTEWREAHLGHVPDALLDREAGAAVPFELVDLLGDLDDLLGLAEVADDNRCARRWISGSFAVAGVEHDVVTERDEFLTAARPRPVVDPVTRTRATQTSCARRSSTSIVCAAVCGRRHRIGDARRRRVGAIRDPRSRR